MFRVEWLQKLPSSVLKSCVFLFLLVVDWLVSPPPLTNNNNAEKSADGVPCLRLFDSLPRNIVPCQLCFNNINIRTEL